MSRIQFWGAGILIVVGAMLLTVLSAVAQPRVRQTAPTYEWRIRDDDPQHVYLYRNGRQVGGWSYEHAHYRTFDAGASVWGGVMPCPIPVPAARPAAIAAEPVVQQPPAAPHCDCKGNCPCRCGPTCHCGEAPGAQGFANHGIDLPKMAELQAGRHYHLNGREVDRAEAFDAVAGDALPDDADALRLTWIGAPDVGAKIRGDVDTAAALANWKGKVSLQSYRDVDEPILKDLGYAPGLAVQAPAGRPLWYCAEYKGAEDLAGGLLLADARRKDPNWDPAKWPALNAPPKPPAPVPAPAPSSLDWLKQNWLLIAAAIAAALLLRRKVQA